MSLDGARTDEERGGDLGVGVTAGDKLRDLLLAAGQGACSRAAPSRSHAEPAREGASTVRLAAGAHPLECSDRGDDLLAVASQMCGFESQSCGGRRLLTRAGGGKKVLDRVVRPALGLRQ